VKFGYRAPGAENLESLYVKTRTEAFGMEAKLAAMMGAAVLSAENYAPYYEKAMKIRRLLKMSLNFEDYDVMVLPAAINGGAYENLGLYALANLCGLPSVSFSYKGCGLQLVAGVKDESALLTALDF
jgi:aspartyl-tRNA(Asn)/glutamyl-tRNA(Gln) amidotransferase subunit A